MIQSMGLDSKFKAAQVVLLREAFEGRPEDRSYTWFVEGREGIFDALEALTSQSASIKANPSAPSAAAHSYHILYILRWANTPQGSPRPEGDWGSSWSKQEVTSEEWGDLKRTIRSEYERFIRWFELNEDWETEEDHLISACAQLPHFAYHLGALRQLISISG
jgi:hypothetical protein